MTEEKILEGWKEIAAFCGWSDSTAKRRRMDLIKADILHTKRSSTTGSKYNVCAWPSDLKAWAAQRTKSGKPI